MKAATAFLKVCAVVLLASCGDNGDPIGVVGNGSIRGTVSDDIGAAVENAAVELTGNDQAARTTTSGADGVYTFADVPPGTYTLAVTPPAGFTVGASGAASVAVAEGSEASPSTLVLDRNGSVTGIVSDSSGTGVANASVALTGNGQAPRSTSSDADGVYTFANVPSGAYTLTVTPPAGFVVGAGTAAVSVAPGAQANASALLLVANGSVQGVVNDDSGVGVASAFVALIAVGQPLQPTQTDADGVYTFTDVAPGTYTLVVSPPPGFALGGPGMASVTVASGAKADAAPFVLTRLSEEAIDSAFAAALGAHLQAATAAGQFSGTVLVARDGKTLFEGAYNLADRAQGIPNELYTKYRVASMNKMLTAVAVLQLVQGGQVQLAAPLITYLPDYPNVELASKVTLHHLLTHTGGTGDIFGQQFDANRLELREVDDYLDLYGTRDLLFEPGAQFSYSNYGFILLGAVIERVSGMSYDDYVAANVLTPAGMTATGAAPEATVVPNRSVGYTWSGATLVSNASTLPYRGTSAGGWYSTVRDLERFADAIREHRLLDAAHTELLLRVKDVGAQYAYGFVDQVIGGRRFVGHNGGRFGMNGTLSFEPDGGYTIVVLSNFDPPTATAIEGFIISSMPK